MTPDDLAELERKFRRAAASGKITIIPPLPRWTRLRLWLTRQVNRASCWLCDHGHDQAAIRLWRVFRMW
jgi:hypothetical protein